MKKKPMAWILHRETILRERKVREGAYAVRDWKKKETTMT